MFSLLLDLYISRWGRRKQANLLAAVPAAAPAPAPAAAAAAANSPPQHRAVFKSALWRPLVVSLGCLNLVLKEGGRAGVSHSVVALGPGDRPRVLGRHFSTLEQAHMCVFFA